MLATELLPLGICFSFTAKTYEIQELLLLEISLRRRITLGYNASAPMESLWVLRELSAPGLHALQESPFGQHEGGQSSVADRPAENKLLKEKDVSFGKASKHS